MYVLASLFLILLASSNSAAAYDLISNEALLVKNVTSQPSAPSKDLSETAKPFNHLPKVENNSLISADLFSRGDVKVTKKICVHGEGTELNSNAFSYDVKIGLKVIFI